MLTQISRPLAAYGDASSLFRALVRAHEELPGTIVLESQTGESPSYLFLEPISSLTISGDVATISTKGQPLINLQNARSALHLFLDPLFLAPQGDVPPCAGFLSYEFLHHGERVTHTAHPRMVPDALFFRYRTTVTLSPACRDTVTVTTTLFDNATDPWWKANLEVIPVTDDPVDYHMPDRATLDQKISALAEQYSSIPHSPYIKKVLQIQELIRDGEVYQVNLSRMFSLPMSCNAFALYDSLCRSDPANFGAFIQGPAASFQIVSASPELFFRTEGETIMCSPIKGTRPRLDDRGEDHSMQKALLASTKDHAELSMIVDLLRNDIGRCAETGSVKVDRHAYLKSHAHVHHLVSDISGTLSSTTCLSDLLFSLFPSGSIAGAPKIASMNVIARLEDIPRGIYTGAIGWIAPQQRACFSVAIRTAMIADSLLHVGAGGGVVIDSHPEDESRESMHKARGIISAWLQLHGNSLPQSNDARKLREH